MKKILSITLLLTICLTLAVSCGKTGDTSIEGVYTHNEKTYAFVSGGVLVYMPMGASFTSFTADADNVTVDGVTIPRAELTKSTLASYTVNEEYFEIKTVAGVKTITALTESGKAQSALVIPSTVGDIAEGVFESSSVKAILLSEGAKLNLSNGCLKNGGTLSVFISGSIAPADLSCGKSLLDGTSGVTFYIEKAALSTYEGHYNWGNFKSNMKGI